MDNDLLILLSKFSVTARKQIGSVNPAKLFKDKEYAKSFFEQADTQGDQALIMLSINLQNRLGLLTPIDIKKPIEINNNVPKEKYLYGDRG